MAICESLGAQSDLNPATLGALDLVHRAAQLAVVLNVAGAVGRVTQNDPGRAIAAARLVLMGAATFGPRKITVDEGAPRASVIHAIEHMSEGFEDAARPVQMRVVEETRNVIFLRTGLRPSAGTTERALRMGSQPWRYMAPPRADTKARRVMALLGELGLRPSSEEALKKGVQRRATRRA